MRTKVVKVCQLEWIGETNTVRMFLFGGNDYRARYTLSKEGIDITQVRALIDGYWSFVDTRIRDGVVHAGDTSSSLGFLDDLRSKGSVIAAKLMTEDMRRMLWKHAAQTDIMVLMTNLDWVPWEATFNVVAGDGCFLCDNCLISRCPDISDDLDPTVKTSSGASRRIVCLDPILDKNFLIDDRRLSEVITNDGEEIFLTTRKHDLVERVRSRRLIHWICEHAEPGLRLSDEIYYGHDDVLAHRFPPASVLFMMSCGSGRSIVDRASLASRVSAVSRCTVVAPLSVVAASVAVDLVRRVNSLLAHSQLSRLSDVWSGLRGIGGGFEPPYKRVTSGDACYNLWFAIYGDCEAELG